MDPREKQVKRIYLDHVSISSDRCFYCGQLGDSVDHWPAISLSDTLPGTHGLRIRSCWSDNDLLGDSHQSTLEDRKAAVATHKRLLALGARNIDTPRPSWKTLEEKRKYVYWDNLLRAIARGDSYPNADSMLEELKGSDDDPSSNNP